MQIELLIACVDTSAGAATAALLEREGDAMPFACEVTDIAQAAAVAAARRPDVLLLDVANDCAQALKLIAQIVAASPATRPLLLRDTCTHEQVVEAIRHGAWGCVLKAVAPPLLAKAVRTVHQGGAWFGRSALLQALQAQLAVQAAGPVMEDGTLTRREGEILRLIGQGLTNKEIGRRLDISDQTVKTHLHRVYSKLNQSGRYKAFLARPTDIQTPDLGAA